LDHQSFEGGHELSAPSFRRHEYVDQLERPFTATAINNSQLRRRAKLEPVPPTATPVTPIPGDWRRASDSFWHQTNDIAGNLFDRSHRQRAMFGREARRTAGGAPALPESQWSALLTSLDFELRPANASARR